MSINNAMLAGVSGLIANAAALSAISDNIANVNTVGYKTNDVDFSTLVTGSGSGPAAGGVTGSGQQLVAQQGTISQTSSPTDLAISGTGMFITTTDPTAITGGSTVEYTRAGSFTPNQNGFLQNTAGLFLQGFPANSQGVVQTAAENLSSLAPINVSSIGGTVGATTAATVNANLDSGQPVSSAAAAAAAGTPSELAVTAAAGAATAALAATAAEAQDPSNAALATAANAAAAAGGATPATVATVVAATEGAYNPTYNSMTAYDPTAGTGVQPDFTMQVPVSDSLGGQQTLQLDFLQSPVANTWYAELQAVPASSITSGAGLVPGQIAAGTVVFSPNGSLDVSASTLFGNPPNPTLSIGASGTAPGAGQVSWASNLGAAAQSLTLNLGASSGNSGITQFNSPSVTQSITTNGTPFGNLSSVSIQTNGDVTANFTNGTSRTIAQVALATFPNEGGLTSISGDAYLASINSGDVSVKTPGTGGAGTLESSALESSTVDLSTEFTNLIISQQAYTASSKVITTADQMTQDLLAIIR
jgi:flagellar hook protein FlgE